MSLDWVQQILRETLGFFPYPATLNVRLESEDEIEIWRQLRKEMTSIEVSPPEASFCRARCFRVRIERKLGGAVLLPDVRNYPKDKIEVIAPVRLKEALQVGDGERITLEFIE
jgi:CTP-dependent riboflavin kinase